MRINNPSLDLQGVGVTLLVLFIVVFVGLQVTATITDEQIEQMERQDGEITDVCMGVFGCGENIDEMLPVFALIVVLSFIATYIHSLPRFPDSNQDDVDDAKQLYIEGEITLLDLEERLEEDIDDEDL